MEGRILRATLTFVRRGGRWLATEPTSTKTYIERRRAEGKTFKESMRCLKRHLSNVVYRQMIVDWRAMDSADKHKVDYLTGSSAPARWPPLSFGADRIPTSRSTLSANAEREVTMVPVEVKGVRLKPAEPTEPTEPVSVAPQDRAYVMLRSPEGSRALDIQIGSAEAFGISSALEGKRWDRPMTHDLLGEVVAALGATLRQVVITEHREDDVYIAEIEVTNQDGNAIRVSARPSDAVALALRLDAPILVNEALFADVA